jgi:transcription elongation factor GreA
LALETELRQKIRRKKLDEVESAWAERAEESPRDLDWFLEVAREMRAAKALPQMADLLSYLVDALGVAGAWEEAFDALREGIALSPRNKDLRRKAIEAARTRYADRDSVDDTLAVFDLEEAEDPLRAFDEMRDWLRFAEGEGFWLFGRGLGKVVETNLPLQKVKLRFEKAAPLVVRRDEARMLLTWIPPDHFMLRRLEDPDGVRKEARANPGDFVRQLLVCFGRPLTAAEIRECMTGVVEGGAWTSWWAKARTHPQVLPSKEKKGAFSWTGSSAEAERSILDEFESASIEERMELARRFGKRGGAIRKGVLEGLGRDLERLSDSPSSRAVEIVLLMEELGGGPEAGPALVESALHAPDAARLIVGVGDRRYRERLYARLQEVRPEDWSEVVHDAFFAETDLRLMSSLYDMLHDEGPEDAAERLVAEAVSTPRNTPAPFVWVAKNALSRDELRPRANHALLSKVAEAIEEPVFKDLKPHLREHFDEGGLAFTVFEKCDHDGADNLLTLIDSAGLEEHRKTAIRRAIFRKYPRIRKPIERDRDVLWATAEATEAKRKEFEHIVRVEIPETTQAIQKAREFGDLSENFEYHAARQKHELLSTRAARLQKELRKTRLIDPDAVDTSVVAVGTRVELEPVAGGAVRTAAVLGPWDSDPDAGVYSHASEIGRRILGRRPDDRVEIDGEEFRITSIRVWHPARDGTTPVPPPGGQEAASGPE